MKKKIIYLILILICITGCNKNDSISDIVFSKLDDCNNKPQLLTEKEDISIYTYCINNIKVNVNGKLINLKSYIKRNKKAIDNISDSVIKNAVKSTALITLMSYSADIIDTKAAKEIIKSKITRDYMVSSMRYKKTLKHIILMLSLIISPFWLKKKIIVRHYTY